MAPELGGTISCLKKLAKLPQLCRIQIGTATTSRWKPPYDQKAAVAAPWCRAPIFVSCESLPSYHVLSQWQPHRERLIMSDSSLAFCSPDFDRAVPCYAIVDAARLQQQWQCGCLTRWSPLVHSPAHFNRPSPSPTSVKMPDVLLGQLILKIPFGFWCVGRTGSVIGSDDVDRGGRFFFVAFQVLECSADGSSKPQQSVTGQKEWRILTAPNIREASTAHCASA